MNFIMKNRSYLSLLLALLMLISVFAGCAKDPVETSHTTTAEESTDIKIETTVGDETDTSSDGKTDAPDESGSDNFSDSETDTPDESKSDASSEGETDDTSNASSDGSEESTLDLTNESTEENTEEDTTVPLETDPLPKLEGEFASLIESADRLANGVNAYFDSGDRKNFITENQNMALKYSTDMLFERKVTALADKRGNKYIENTMDIFVKMTYGGTYYTSKTANSAKVSQFAGLNIFRFGYYYYDVRIEDQNFVNEIKVIDELTLDIKNIASE